MFGPPGPQGPAGSSSPGPPLPYPYPYLYPFPITEHEREREYLHEFHGHEEFMDHENMYHEFPAHEYSHNPHDDFSRPRPHHDSFPYDDYPRPHQGGYVRYHDLHSLNEEYRRLHDDFPGDHYPRLHNRGHHYHEGSSGDGFEEDFRGDRGSQHFEGLHGRASVQEDQKSQRATNCRTRFRFPRPRQLTSRLLNSRHVQSLRYLTRPPTPMQVPVSPACFPNLVTGVTRLFPRFVAHSGAKVNEVNEVAVEDQRMNPVENY
ncbi:hypothetical protein EI94DRAFT_593674 [Lactarius quietus]|nr:hypothetical protein EI94DRAFT_593674 [Lactarius quietus]